MAIQVQTRRSVWGLSVGTLQRALSDAWDPVLDTYARGVEAMKNLDATLAVDSWRWAANTHGAPVNAGNRPLWRQCVHGKTLFLPWHRAYVHWFESTIRRLTRQPGWALPYWDYTDPDRPATRGLPPEFLVRTRTVNGRQVANPLFQPGRLLVRLEDRVPAADVELVRALSTLNFAGRFPVLGFGGVDDPRNIHGEIETEPHDFVHGRTGGIMGRPSTAAADPIFWLHHANIDRFWEVWRRLPGSVELLAQPGLSNRIMTEWRSARYNFGDAARPVTYTARDVENTVAAPLGYQYESLTLPTAIARRVTANRAAQGVGGPMGIDDTAPAEREWVPVASRRDIAVHGDGAGVELPFDRRQLGLDDSTPTGLVLELAGVKAQDPHIAYEVSVAAGPGQPVHRAGHFGTFGLADADDVGNTYLIDASSVIDSLREDGWSGADLVVRVTPEGAAETAEGIDVEQLTVHVTRS